MREGESEGGSVLVQVERVLLDPEVVSLNSGNSTFLPRERKNKIAQGDVNIFSHLTFFFNFDIFKHFDRKLRIQSTKYYHICNQQVNFSRNDTSLASFQKFYFWRPF